MTEDATLIANENIYDLKDPIILPYRNNFRRNRETANRGRQAESTR